MIRRSVAVTIAVTFQQLIEGSISSWSFDQQLVIEALRRSSGDISDASEAELGEYLRGFDRAGLQGVTSNVKGIYHELLVEHLENTDGDDMFAQIFEQTNHPGADIEFLIDSEVVHQVQLKAVQDPASIIEHFSKYPDIDVRATTEVFEVLQEKFGDRLGTSGISNEELSQATRDTLEHLAGENLGDVLQDGVVTSLLVGGALQAKAILEGQAIDAREVRSTLEIMGVAAGTAFTVDALLGLV
ncbi:hypothetical protein OU789_01385 [Halocynthiibacter sp. C4]|uniref:hypothetical protein n=1 Tax=Halocynthiibacter sp. C4 TaxID=2992758 RepID=UPI00237A84B1|nr:hypothetical protein [Halocynthiibacter sp. C4]MDE0588571.1 hypothetical protein [Halocynthiibacter sp. C4]